MFHFRKKVKKLESQLDACQAGRGENTPHLGGSVKSLSTSRLHISAAAPTAVLQEGLPHALLMSAWRGGFWVGVGEEGGFQGEREMTQCHLKGDQPPKGRKSDQSAARLCCCLQALHLRKWADTGGISHCGTGRGARDQEVAVFLELEGWELTGSMWLPQGRR